LSSDETGLAWDKDPVKTYLTKTRQAPPGTRFNYSGGSTQTLMEALAELEGRPFLDLVRQDLFVPLGIADWSWATGDQGAPLAFAGLRLKPRDMGRIGLLVLGHGVWNGRQVVPADWID
jgi:CubicO group peptidase (beta-lactamase class C family)